MELSINDLKELLSTASPIRNAIEKLDNGQGLNEMVGKKVIVRTYSAGVWFGVLYKKDKDEVILQNARRMWRWWAAKSISLSAVAIHGIRADKSKICEPVYSVWLAAIEIIPCTEDAIKSLECAPYVEAE